MVQLTRLSHRPFVLNCDLIELIETTPDTVISLTNGQKLIVRETPEEIIQRVRDYKRSVLSGLCPYQEVSPSNELSRDAGASKPLVTESSANGRF